MLISPNDGGERFGRMISEAKANCHPIYGTTEGKMVQDFSAHLAPGRYLTGQEVAAYLSVSRPHVYALARDKKLRAVRIGRSVRFRSEDLIAFIEANTNIEKQTPSRVTGVGNAG